MLQGLNCFLIEQNLKEGRDSGAVAGAVTGLHVEVGGGALAEVAGNLHSLDLGGFRALRVEVALSCNVSCRRHDDAPEVGVGRCEPRRLVSDVGGASDVQCVHPMAIAAAAVGLAVADNVINEIRSRETS